MHLQSYGYFMGNNTLKCKFYSNESKNFRNDTGFMLF